MQSNSTAAPKVLKGHTNDLSGAMKIAWQSSNLPMLSLRWSRALKHGKHTNNWSDAMRSV